ncbi:FAD-binding-3 domain-containing protein [Mycena venus]|uniref:FAD-binding-3 domain-containing protein n=1 Tax=Mycena venus TaxID=2733690 RepID=A0A8H6YC96_9AGAR|nr:FAD-binding-3 domain-containing protein [Mycena venus]
MTDFSCDVLIVGAGPSGLILALCLSMSGVSVRIIDKEPVHRVGRRGAGITPRTLEIFQTLGVLDDVLKLAHNPVPFQSYKLPEGIEPEKTWDMAPTLEPTPACPFRNSMFLGQDQVESILRERLKPYACAVELGTELIGFEQHDDRVCATISVAGAEEEINVKYLVGADGAKGIVRNQLGLSFLGQTREEDHLVMSDVIIEDLDSEHVHLWTQVDATILVWPGQTETNLFSVQLAGTKLERQKLASDPDELRAFFRTHTGRAVRDIIWVSEYIPNIRMVDEMRKDRAFLVGDAAHVHSLFGGQGMNAGVQDSYNLGWKLAGALLGLTSLDLLSTYSEERLPVIAEMLNKTSELQAKALESRTLNDISRWKRSKSLDQLGINYRWSSIVVEESRTSRYTDEVVTGDRAPDAPGLVEIEDGGGIVKRSLFQIFSYTVHTVLIFFPPAELSVVSGILRFLADFPQKGIIHPVVIYPAGFKIQGNGTDVVLCDRYGHAWRAYDVPADSVHCVVVRPDGMVGAKVAGVPGLRKYFDIIFRDRH